MSIRKFIVSVVFLFVGLSLAFGFPSSVLASPRKNTTLKLVFPFSAAFQTSSICPIPQRTPQGCCPDARSVYNYSGKKACCFEPNELLTYGDTTACCTQWKSGQTRWGRTESHPCGGYCPPTSQHVSAGGYSSCCTDCALVDGVRAFETSKSVCGTCCSRIPESCGNAGVRVCTSETGSAYCSKVPDKCNDPQEWLIGSMGEGGYNCCSKCTGFRYSHTNSYCGSCCNPPDLVLSYGGVTSCCTSFPLIGQNRWGQTSSSVCGGYCDLATSAVYSYSGYTSCCKSCAGVTAFQSGPGNVCGTCCSAVPNNCGTAGTRVCTSATGSAYCSSDINKCQPPTNWIIGTAGEGGYTCCPSCNGTRYNHTAATCGNCCPAGQEVVNYGGVLGCCPPVPAGNYRAYQTTANVCGQACANTPGGTVCCTAGQSAYAYYLVQTTAGVPTWITGCGTNNAAVYGGAAGETYPCPTGTTVAGKTQTSFYYNTTYYFSIACCGAGTTVVGAMGGGVTCCPPGQTAAYRKTQEQDKGAAGWRYFVTECCNAGSVAMQAYGNLPTHGYATQGAMCCTNGKTAALTYAIAGGRMSYTYTCK